MMMPGKKSTQFGKVPLRYEGDDYSKTADRTNRCAEDYLIRQFGFEIFSRPANKEAMWKRGQHYYSHQEALYIAKSQREKALKAIEAAHG